MVVGPPKATRSRLSSTATKNLIKRLYKLIRIGIRERHGRSDFDHVVKWAFGTQQYSAFAHLIYNAARFLYELDAEKKPGAADFANHFVTLIQFVEAVEQTFANTKCVRLQVFFVNYFQHLQPDRT